MEAVDDAINSANEKGIHILNISLGTSDPEFTEDEQSMTALRNAIMDFSGLIVCAAGNNFPSFSTDNFPLYPSCMLDTNGQDLDNVISVGASTNADEMFISSCFGQTSVDLFAPGTSILNCYPTELCCNNAYCTSPNHTDATCDANTHSADGYHSLSGTSMAAPHVAGVAALLLSIHPELTAAELKQVIMNSVDVILDDSDNSVFGELCVSGGRLNAYKALADSSIHNFGRWMDWNSTYHSRTCLDCGYVEMQAHLDSWDSIRSVCTVCNRTGTITYPYAYPPSVETAIVCEDDCTDDCA